MFLEQREDDSLEKDLVILMKESVIQTRQRIDSQGRLLPRQTHPKSDVVVCVNTTSSLTSNLTLILMTIIIVIALDANDGYINAGHGRDSSSKERNKGRQHKRQDKNLNKKSNRFFSPEIHQQQPEHHEKRRENKKKNKTDMNT